MNTKSLAYLISFQLYARVCVAGRYRNLTIEQYSEAGYEKVDTGQQAKYIPENIVVMDADIPTLGLSPRAFKLFLSIIPKLHLNNALWYFDATKNSNDSKAIRELREHKILLKTEDPKIHFVNPDYLRKGSKPGVLALTMKELETVSRVAIDNIKPLGTKKVETNVYDMMTNAGKDVGEEERELYLPEP